MSKRHSAFNFKNLLILALYYGFLFILVTASTTSLVAARYISEKQLDVNGPIAPFAPQILINDHSNDNLYFSNTDPSLNTPQTTNFVVQNHKNSVVTGVDLKFSLIFYVPTETLGKSATIQLTKKDADGKDVAITPLYEVEKLLGTADFNTIPGAYQSLDAPQETLTYASVNGVRTFTAKVGETVTSTITVEQVTQDATCTVFFALWTDEVTLIEPQLLLKQEQKAVPYTKITISRPEFILEGMKKSEQHISLRVIPTEGMSDTVNPIDKDFTIDWNSLKGKITAADLVLYDKKVVTETDEVWKMSYASTDHKLTLWQTLNGTEKEYSEVLVGYTSDSTGTDTERYSYGKTYPCRMNALFEQIEQVP